MSNTSTTKKNSKEQIVLDAATKLFLNYGFSATTTDMIRKEAGISKTTLYTCFPNKEALFAAVIERQCSYTSASVLAIETTPGNIAKMLTDIGMSYLTIILTPSGIALFRTITAAAPHFPELGRHFYLAGPKAVSRLVAVRLEEAAKAGEIDVQAIGIEAAAKLFIDILRSAGLLEALTHPNSQPSAAQMDNWVHIAVTTFMRAYGVQHRK